ncbi:MAG: porin [Limisphaerales bacterium]
MMFMEPASVLQAIAPGVNAGLQVGRPVFADRLTWALGLFTDAAGEDFGDATEGFGRAVGRLSGLPVYQYDPEHPDSQRLLHLGLSGSLLYAGDSIVRYRSRPESHLAPYLVDTGEMEADGAYTAGLETAWVNGPLCLQGEALHSWLQQDGRNSDFGGFYASASWFLTGESRPYDRQTGTFGRVIPKRDFHFDGGGWRGGKSPPVTRT